MTEWRLIAILDSDGTLQLGLQRGKTDGGPDSIEIEFELSILNTTGSPFRKESCTEHFRNEGISKKNFKLFHTNAIKISEFFRDTLTIRCCMKRTSTELSKSELCFARTYFSVHESFCVWAVKGFSSLQQGEKRTRILNSTIGCPQVILALFLTVQNNNEYVVIDVEVPGIYIYAEIALLDVEGRVVCFKRGNSMWWISEPWICRLCEFKKSELISNKALLSDDVLVLRCEMLLYPDTPVSNRIEDYRLMDYSDSKSIHMEKTAMLPDELSKSAVCPFKAIVSKFKEDGTLSDVCLRVNTKSFPVHKLVLGSRSSVFRAMFTKDMREKTSKIIDIPDLDADTLGGLLLYIYEDKVQELTWEAAADLFEAADKYELLDLKEKCSGILKSNLTEYNFCKILVLADMHHDESLRRSAQECILNNSEILHSEIWKVFRENHSKLAMETTEQIIYNMTKHSRS